jgi:hypothetical protein
MNIKTTALVAAVAFGLGLSAALPSFAATMQCSPGQITATASLSGTTYTADTAGIVTGIANNDLSAMVAAGCVQVGNTSGLVGRLLKVNMNLAGAGTAGEDQQIPLFLPAGQFVRYTKITAKNCSGSVTTALGGAYTASAQGGTAVVAAGQAYSGNTGATLSLDLTIATTPGKTIFGGATAPTLFVNLSTAQGAAMTCDFFVYGDVGN